MSTAILSIANSVGIGIGIFMTQLFVSDNVVGGEATSQIHNLSEFHAILATVLLAPAFILFKNKPPTPPR